MLTGDEDAIDRQVRAFASRHNLTRRQARSEVDSWFACDELNRAEAARG